MIPGSRLNSVYVEVEEVTAELLVPSACPEVVGIDGDAAAAPARSRPWRLGLGFRESEEKGRERVRAGREQGPAASSYPLEGGSE